MYVTNEPCVNIRIFEKEIGKVISEMSIIRNRSDYDDFYIATKEQGSQAFKTLKFFMKRLKNIYEKL